MLTKLKPKSEFSRNVLTLMTGTTIAQAIPIAISPILTRIYTPEDFGVFALFVAISAIISVIATGRYEMVIMLPKKEVDAFNIMSLSFLIAVFISLFFLLIVFFFNIETVKMLNTPEISDWLYFIPLTIFMTGVYQSLNYWHNRKKMYQVIATNKVVQSTTVAGSNLGFGFNGFGTSGLILGTLIGQIAATLLIAKKFLKTTQNKREMLNKKKMIVLAKKYKNFPKFNAPHALMNSSSANMPIFMISYFFNSTYTGFFALANRVLLSPIGLFTYSFGQVFLQKLTHNKNLKENEEIFFNNILLKLLGYSFLPFFLFFIFAPSIFGIVFGKDWIITGEYAQILVPMLYFTFTGSILSNVIVVYNEQKKALKLEFINISTKFLSLLVGGLVGSIEVGLILYTISGISITTHRLFWYKSIIKERHEI
jgi:O-antigen/teichoic acid export membrane protein